MHCVGQHKPYAEWHKPYAEWHKPCRYYRLLFRNLQAPPQIPATVFCGFPPVLTTTLLALLPMAYAADFRGWFSTSLIAAPSAFCCWLPLLFPSADPSRLRRRPIGIFAGFLSAGLYQELPPRFSPVPLGQRGCYGSCPAGGCPTFGALCFLSVIDGVAPYQNLISDETAWIKAVSLVFLRSIAWHRAAAPVVCGSD